MGAWGSPVEMAWTEAGWMADLTLPAGERVEFKFLILRDGGGEPGWEDGANRVLEVPGDGGEYHLSALWGHQDAHLEKEGGGGGGSAPAAQNRAASAEAESAEAGGGGEEPEPPKEEVPSNGNAGVEASEFGQRWQGKGTSFMRSNDHSHDRSGQWDTVGLGGAALRLVEGDKDAGSWRKKLEVVSKLVTESDKEPAEELDTFVNTAIYLQWINTGQIQCVEDGGHHRPNRHAELARTIFRQLEKKMAAKSTPPQEVMVMRQIHPRLPAFTAEFTASVPLTRIRDIAHRNDIPHDLKQEIKHTIQNKLHRNAGPEDLVATEQLLNRVTAPGAEYSQGFLDELRTFYRELQDFFNAASLTDQLAAIRPSLDDNKVADLEQFLEAKKKLDSSNGSAAAGGAKDKLLACMHSLTGLRAALLSGLASGLRNDASDESIAMRQKWRLAEIGLEDYSFVLLSRFLNAMEEEGGAAWLAEDVAGSNAARFAAPLGATVLGVRQLGLSGWQQAECVAVENELMAWQQAGVAPSKDGAEADVREWALRLKATLDRTRRLSESYTESALQIYPDRAEMLGKAFGIPENTVRTYAEADIRASVVFQLAKLCSLLLKAVRQVAGVEGWDALMTGTAVGKLVKVDKIVPGAIPASSRGDKLILLVREADGDEEVKAAGENVAGVILCQELPHLSHLGVRARQEGVVFVTCDDEEKIAEVQALADKSVRLEASAEGVTVCADDGVGSSAAPKEAELAMVGSKKQELEAAGGSSVQHSQVTKASAGSIIQLAESRTDTTGSKASACGQLARLALEATSGSGNGTGPSSAFEVPTGVAIPFGVMEQALEASGSLKRFEALVEKAEVAKVEGGELDQVCDELRSMVASQRLPAATIKEVGNNFSKDARLIVRSSANVEDLAGMSGAGLYDSIPNVRPSEPEEFAKAVAEVWASLYTRRAVLSRRVANVAQKEAAMAVLVQELLKPDLSFVLHTVSPVDRDASVVQAEVAAGLGETLASGTRGSPWRLAASKDGGDVKTLAFANFSDMLVVEQGSADGRMVKKVADYSKQKLSLDASERKSLGSKLAKVGKLLEDKLGAPQDVEGAVVDGKIFIVQARPQP
eukprot:SM000014S00301  [mRNA]  locus=s14:501177:507786:- [translate_table: standard]